MVSTFNFQTLNMFYCFRVITESTVLDLSKSVIFSFFLFSFFFTAGMSDASE